MTTYTLPQQIDQLVDDAIAEIKRLARLFLHGNSDEWCNVYARVIGRDWDYVQLVSRWGIGTTTYTADDYYGENLLICLWSWAYSDTESDVTNWDWVADDNGKYIGDVANYGTVGDTGTYDEWTKLGRYPAHWQRFNVDYASWQGDDLENPYWIDADELKALLLQSLAKGDDLSSEPLE